MPLTWKRVLRRLVTLAVALAVFVEGLTQHGYVRWMLFGIYALIAALNGLWEERQRRAEGLPWWHVGFQSPWRTAAYGLFAIGVGVAAMVMRHPNDLVGSIWLAYGVLFLVGGLAARVSSGTWRKRPRTGAKGWLDDWLAPLS